MGLTYTVGAREGIRALPAPAKRRVKAALRLLDEDPFHDALDLKRLRRQGPYLYRCRVGSFRIVFRIDGPTVHILRVFHRRDGYGWLERL